MIIFAGTQAATWTRCRASRWRRGRSSSCTFMHEQKREVRGRAGQEAEVRRVEDEPIDEDDDRQGVIAAITAFQPQFKAV